MNSFRTAACPICGDVDLRDEGRVVHPVPATVSGVPIDLGNAEYRIIGCCKCLFRWKSPDVPPDRLEYCYRHGHHSGEEPKSEVRPFALIKQLLAAHSPGPNLLDIGCDTGGLLKYIGEPFNLFGVEPSEFGRVRAAEKKIDILGATLSDIKPGVRFDAILAIDVLEHLSDPSAFIASASSFLNKNGILVIMTGDSEAWPWRLHGSRYCYVSIPCHLSFVTAATLRQIGRSCGLSEVVYLRTPHKLCSHSIRLKEMAKGFVYSMGRAVGMFEHRHGPWWTSANDHLIHVSRRSDSE